MPTALDLKPDEIEKYRKFAKKKLIQKKLTPDQRAERAELLEKVRKAAEMLKSIYGANRVILFGSLVHEAWYSEDSDVDLAVEGIKPAEYWRAWRDIEKLFQSRQIDLIDYEFASESLKKAVDQDGMEV